MVKLVFMGIFLVCCGAFILFQDSHEKSEKKVPQKGVQSPTITLSPTISAGDDHKDTTLFVPYWTLDDEQVAATAHTLLYFGIAPDKTGIDKSDIGYQKMDSFIKASDGVANRYLTVRMLDKTFNADVLENKVLQETIITQSISEAKEHGFTGIVLDYELAALSFDSVIKKISAFYHTYSQAVHDEHLFFGITVYGDVFYRMRPYDVKALAKDADMMYVMAYDFHKARENPGPNFPLSGKMTYGYDMAAMTTDFLTAIPPNKITIIFGMFGYDWAVDKKMQSIENATPLSLQTIKKKFLPNCRLNNCTVKRDANSSETMVTYTDDEEKKHAVWFEDTESVAKKKAYLESRGIQNFGYWAYSYF